MLDFFPSEECASILGGLVRATIFRDQNVVGDSGTIQNAIASALIPGETFYVNAKNENDNRKYLFKYGASENSNLALYHFVSKNIDEKKCLTFGSDEAGNLVSEPVNCNSEHRPLCLDFDLEKLGDFTEKCEECVPNIAECKRWVDLAMFPVDGVTIEGAELCVQPCGPERTYQESSEYCQVMSCSYNNLYLLANMIFFE